MVRDRRIAFRMNEKEEKILERVKELMGIKDSFGADSKAIRSALKLYYEVRLRAIDRFNSEFPPGSEMRLIIEDYLKKTSDKR